MAAILFALVLHPLILTIAAEVPSLAAHCWFHDDGSAAGSIEELKQVVEIVRREGPARGLFLNDDKSSVWCSQVTGPGQADPLLCGIKRVQETGVKLLGCPVGSNEFIKNFFTLRPPVPSPLISSPHSLPKWGKRIFFQVNILEVSASVGFQ